MFAELRELLRSGAIRRHQLGPKVKKPFIPACGAKYILPHSNNISTGDSAREIARLSAASSASSCGKRLFTRTKTAFLL